MYPSFIQQSNTFSIFAKILLAVIDGVSHNITPENNSNVNAWSEAVGAGRHNDDSKSQTEHLKDFSTWTENDIKVSTSPSTL
jgi:hypothetical protein